jgi:hypothetical protein
MKAMRTGARIAIGLAALIAGSYYLMSAIAPDNQTLSFFLVTFFCIVMAITCFFPKTSPVTLRIIGAAIFIGCIAHLRQSILKHESASKLLGATLQLVTGGIPCLCIAITGRLPSWDMVEEIYIAVQNREKR